MPIEPGRPRDPDVDERIVSAAQHIVDTEGPGAVTITRVAQQAGVGRPTVYRRYKDADDLLRGVLFAHLESIAIANKDIEISNRPFVDLLMMIASPSFDFYAEHIERSRALLTVAVFAGPEWQARWTTLNSGVAALAVRCFEHGIERGELPTDTNIMLAVNGFLSLFLAILIGGLTGVYGGVDGWKVVLRGLLEQHYEGLVLRAQIDRGPT